MVTNEETNRGKTSNKPMIATPMIATNKNRVVCNVLRGAADWTSTSSEILLLKVAEPAWVIQ
jgi:hypothetical protein